MDMLMSFFGEIVQQHLAHNLSLASNIIHSKNTSISKQEIYTPL